MENIKEKYYVFLSIDGALWDGQSAFQQHGPFAKEITKPVLKKSSVQAVNFLLENLENQFDTHLVITSRHRENMPSCVDYLTMNGLKYNKAFLCTPFVPGERGQKIIDFMEECGIRKFTYPTKNKLIAKLFSRCENPDYSNFVVIDSNKKRISQQIPAERTIITNPKRQSLTQKQVEDYLQKINVPFVSQIQTEQPDSIEIPQM